MKASAGCVCAITKSPQRNSTHKTHSDKMTKRKKQLTNKILTANSALTFQPTLVRTWTLPLIWKTFSKVHLTYVSSKTGELQLSHPHCSIREFLAGLLHIKHTRPKQFCGCCYRALHPKFSLPYFLLHDLLHKKTVKSLYWLKVHLEFVAVKKTSEEKYASRKYGGNNFRRGKIRFWETNLLTTFSSSK